MVMTSTLVAVTTLVSALPAKEVAVAVTVCVLMVVAVDKPAALCLSSLATRSRVWFNWQTTYVSEVG